MYRCTYETLTKEFDIVNIINNLIMIHTEERGNYDVSLSFYFTFIITSDNEPHRKLLPFLVCRLRDKLLSVATYDDE